MARVSSSCYVIFLMRTRARCGIFIRLLTGLNCHHGSKYDMTDFNLP
jgi:hypothetical protein